ncbi:MauE/DoxX family redox-associated membrane protein [Sediminibacterium ginsengisoli]|uniref:Methylamine utilisation protein MauE n=1 Tax=Sediminibacterium ginsengisoli TaxID=413434 RepID=A0A1T4NX77_9BACT|nr:MauE/DoxX family redox-associated membrane protein [Sediminibacterium ginsengisoli]SJZ83970.1 Methylamine utilisation protein MauE [Sediminibacterium ginsengisoli]
MGGSKKVVSLSLMNTSLFKNIIAGIFVLLFMYTGFSKLIGLGQFQSSLYRSPLLSDYAYEVSILIPVTEIFIAILLCLPRTQRKGMILSFGLMAVFTIYIAYMLLTAEKLPCSCGGIIAKLNWKQHLVLNGLLTLLAFVSLFIKARAPANERLIGPSSNRSRK